MHFAIEKIIIINRKVGHVPLKSIHSKLSEYESLAMLPFEHGKTRKLNNIYSLDLRNKYKICLHREEYTHRRHHTN